MVLVVLVAAQLLTKSAGLVSQLGPQLQGKVQRFKPRDNESFSIGVMNGAGVTKYSNRHVEAVRSKSGRSWWPDAAARSTSQWAGATDLSDNVSWGWHHPNGVYSTIPVGAPLIDADMNIYLGTDDAVRKFTSVGGLLWSYAPRGQLAAAPSLLDMSARRFKELMGEQESDSADDAAVSEDAEMSEELAPSSWLRRAHAANVIDDITQDSKEVIMGVEQEVVPDWAKPASGGDNTDGTVAVEQKVAPVRLQAGPSRLQSRLQSMLASRAEDESIRVKAGDLVRVRRGVRHEVGDKLYQAGDLGVITKTIYEGAERKVSIHWSRTGQGSTETLESLSRLFRHIESKLDTGERATSVLVGSTTSGFVFAIDTVSGEELWVTQASDQIAGVKGVVSGRGAVVVSATDRCTDRYCYKYRSQVNPLTPGNSRVRGMLAIDGSQLWSFKPASPVWNFQPQYGSGGDTVMFSDFEGTVYCLGLMTGTLLWKQEGSMGTYTQAAAVYSATLNQIFAFGLESYEGKDCNPFVPVGIKLPCSTHVGSPGWMRAYNATSGRVQWEKSLPEPPSSASIGKLNTPRLHTRIVVTMGHNCHYGARSLIWGLDPNGHLRWEVEGPTMWTQQCAGDKEGGDIRRAMGGRAACDPGTWSAPAIDANGDIYVGNQVGILQRLGADGPNGGGARDHSLLSTLSTEVAFQDNAIAFAPGMMAVSTCTSLIVFETYTSNATFGQNDTWEFPPSMY